jgi:hypothetical protein
MRKINGGPRENRSFPSRRWISGVGALTKSSCLRERERERYEKSRDVPKVPH